MKRTPRVWHPGPRGNVPFYWEDSPYIVGVNGDVAPCDVQLCGCIVRTADLAHCVFNRQSNKFSSPYTRFILEVASAPYLGLVNLYQSCPAMSRHFRRCPASPRGCQTQVRVWVRMQPRISLCARMTVAASSLLFNQTATSSGPSSRQSQTAFPRTEPCSIKLPPRQDQAAVSRRLPSRGPTLFSHHECPPRHDSLKHCYYASPSIAL